MKIHDDKVVSRFSPLLQAALIGVMYADARKAGGNAAPANVPHEQDTIEDLQARMCDVHERGEAIRATSDAEHRMLTDAEQKQLDDLSEQFEQLDAEVKRRERLAAQRERLNTPQRRVTQPAPIEAQEGDDPQPRQRVTGGDLVGASKNTWGWRSLGEFAKGVIQSTRGSLDKRLVAAATTFGNEGAGQDGGFAIPPEFRENIMKKVQAEEGLLARTDQQFSSSNKLTVPQDNTTPWQTSGGITVAWEGEANQSTGTKPQLGQLEVKLHKIKALVPMTDELMEDVAALSRYLPGKVADKFVSAFNTAIVNGDGIGKPQGLLNSASKITQAKEGGQAAATIVFLNIVKMWSRMYGPLRQNAVWLINQDIEPQLLGLVAPGSNWPAYLPPGGLSNSPFGQILGRPVIPIEAAQTVGTEGDIILANLQTYLTVQKVSGIRQDVSIHLFFDQDVTAFRFVFRLGGQSWYSAPIARQNGANTLSNIVTCQTR
jgi:HK97 family phage major capsid protein